MAKNLYINLKSILDPIIACLLLLFFLPLILFVSLLIKLDSSGSIIFSQIRMGKNKKLFHFYKFRTMYSDAKDRFPELYRYNYASKEIKTLKFKLKDDPRLTILGKKLRRTSLDEIPNLINVLRGEMSLVGPRPELPEMLKYYKKNQLAKFSVKPGITGLAQTRGRGFLTFRRTIELDTYYVKHESILLDLKIILKTIIVVLKGIGAF